MQMRISTGDFVFGLIILVLVLGAINAINQDSSEKSEQNYIIVHQVMPDKDVVVGTLRYPPRGVSAQIHTLVGENQEDHEFIASLKPGDHIICDSYGKWKKVN